MIMGPWSLVLLLSFLVNKWQLMFRPTGGLLWYSVDWLDQRVPSLVEWLLWLVYQISLVLHVVTVGINLGVIWVSVHTFASTRAWPVVSAAAGWQFHLTTTAHARLDAFSACAQADTRQLRMVC